MSLNSSICEDINPLLDAYHDGELDEIERDTVASHLASCLSCQAKISQIKNVVSSLKNLPRKQMSHDLSADADFLKRALAASLADNLEPVAANSTDRAGAEIKKFPTKLQPSGKPSNKKLLPLPGPVIFASVAAAAALALVISVPRYLSNNSMSPSVASLPKQSTPKSNESLGNSSTAVAEKSAPSEIKLPHNQIGAPGTAPGPSEQYNHELVHNVIQPNDANGHDQSKDAQTISHTIVPKIASAQVPAVTVPNMPTTSAVVDSTDWKDSQSVSQGEQTTEEHDLPASLASSPEQGELLALYPSDQNTITDELAIPTDEDGLYALKL